MESGWSPKRLELELPAVLTDNGTAAYAVAAWLQRADQRGLLGGYFNPALRLRRCLKNNSYAA